MRTSALLLAFTILTLPGVCAESKDKQASSTEPKISSIYPAGGQRGTAFDAEVHGSNMADARGVIFEGGGPSHVDTWDPKPNSAFKPISTNVPGIQISELLPETARLMARRLVEAGAGFVTAAGFHSNSWDTHAKNDEEHRDRSSPPLTVHWRRCSTTCPSVGCSILQSFWL